MLFKFEFTINPNYKTPEMNPEGRLFANERF